MPKKSQVLALLELRWSYRRIEAETGVRRETASRYDGMRQAKAAKTFPGSEEVRFQPGFNLIVGVNGVGRTSVLHLRGLS
jgi:hypothetical protein